MDDESLDTKTKVLIKVSKSFYASPEAEVAYQTIFCGGFNQIVIFGWNAFEVIR